jgi:ABC-type nitrate/sulfonate/bicarbonate transport system substrate-binding protein
MKRCIVAMAFAVAMLGGALAQSVPQKPLADVVSAKLKPVSAFTYAPVITWGGDVHTQLALTEGLFKKGGIDIKLIREDNFVNQVQNCMDGKTPFLRGTLGMIRLSPQAQSW